MGATPRPPSPATARPNVSSCINLNVTAQLSSILSRTRDKDSASLAELKGCYSVSVSGQGPHIFVLLNIPHYHVTFVRATYHVGVC